MPKTMTPPISDPTPLDRLTDPELIAERILYGDQIDEQRDEWRARYYFQPDVARRLRAARRVARPLLLPAGRCSAVACSDREDTGPPVGRHPRIEDTMKLSDVQRDVLKRLEAKRQLSPYDRGAARALRQVARSGQPDNDTVERVDRLLAKPAQAGQ